MSANMEKWEAGQIVRTMLRGDHFQSYSSHDRTHDPDGVYEIESSITVGASERFFWNREQRKALAIVGRMTPEERRFHLEIDEGH